MNKLIKEISAIVSQYGVDIVIEERFVNILKDLYPDRDHPEKFEILRAIVDEGVSSIMLSSCNAKTAKSVIYTQAKSLSQKYGYDIRDITQILSCLCIGCDCITIDDYNRLFTPPKPQPAKPRKNKQIPNIIYMILGYLGFFVTPFIMLLHHSGSSLFLTLLLVLVIHALTIIPCAIGLYKRRPNFLYGGLFCGLMFCLAICLLKGTLDYEDKELMNFLGIGYDYNSPFGLTICLSVILAFLYLAGTGFGSEIAGLDTTDLYSAVISGGMIDSEDFKPIKKSLTNIKFLIGLFSSLIIGVLFSYLVHTLPLSYSFINNSVIEITENRNQKNVELSFMDFKLGSSIDSCISVVSKSPRYYYSSEDQFNYQNSYSESKELSHNLCVQGFYYSAFIDSVIVIGSELDNSRILIKLYSNKNKVFAIEYLTHQNQGTLKEGYKTKYGRYELFPNMAKDHFFKNRVSYFNYNDRYYWIYKNCLIELSVNEWHGLGRCQDVVYISRQFEPILERDANERIIQEEKQKKEQKIKEERQKQEAKKRAEEELKEKEDAHQKAIDEI